MRLPTVADVERLLPSPDDFDDARRGPRTASRVGLWLGIAFTVCFLTGLWSHAQYAPPSWLPVGPRPTQLYRVTQGLHVVSGTAAIPLLLVKLWSVYPRLFLRPRLRPARAAVVTLLERGSIGVLVASAVFQLASGVLNVVQWYPWDFSFRATHHAVAWLAVGALLVHVAVKLPVIREALGAPVDDAAPPPEGPTRRDVVRTAYAGAGLAVLLTAGQTVPWLRRISVFGVRDGDGPQDLPVNRTARAAGATQAASDPAWRLEVAFRGATTRLDRESLGRLPQRTHRLPIACVEGWSRNAIWTGVAVRDLLDLVGAPADADVVVHSLQTRGAFATTTLPGAFVADPRTLLALTLNGETLDLDHGFPCRIIAPNRPGVLQTKWVARLEVRA